MNKNKLQSLAFGLFIISCGVGFYSLIVLATNTLTKDRDKTIQEQAEKFVKDKAYNLTHPVIVGTNENGEVIKCYTIPISPWNNHYVYEVGNTRTDNMSLGKQGLQVTAEKH